VARRAPDADSVPRVRHRPLLFLPLLLLFAAAPAAAQTGSRQTATVQFTEQRPGTSSGLRIRIAYNPGAGGAKPFAVQRVVTALAPGATIDTSAPARCGLSDADLIANGARGCPGASIVGSGVATFSALDANPTTTMDVTLINNANELIFLASTQGGSGARLVIRSPIRGATITTEVPRLPGGPPDGIVAIRTADLRIGATPGYITTPKVCPASGAFANSGVFTYFDGVTQTVPSLSACVDLTAPAITLAGIPRRGCARRDVRARVRIDDNSALRGVVVRLNGRKLKTTRSKRFSVRVRKARMRKGRNRNRVTVTAVDARGNRFVRTRRFTRCS